MAGLHLALHLLIWNIIAVANGYQPPDNSRCNSTDEVCEFWLEVDYKMTMMLRDVALYPHDGRLYRYDVTDPSTADPVPTDDVITADGWEQPRIVIAVNGTLPGPIMQVYEGQTVTIHVTNKLPSEAITLHLHGLEQRGTPWMDGVAFVTQCPVLPGQSFTHTFKATPAGSYWYHAHIASQRSMGLHGAFIIKERKPPEPEMEEFIMSVQDWNHLYDSTAMHLRMLWGFYENRRQIPKTDSLDGTHYSQFVFHSGLINGRGRYYSADGQHNGAPLELFKVRRGQQYRFRVINAANQFSFRVAVGGHDLTIVASDSGEIRPVTVQSFVIHPGERYDFVLTAEQPVDNYLITCKTLEEGVNHIAEAILRYEGAPSEDPQPIPTNCSPRKPCVVANCPFSKYPWEPYTECLTFDELQSQREAPAPEGPSDEVEEFFLNFAMRGLRDSPSSINGRVFQYPTVSALTQPQDIKNTCDKAACKDDEVCVCTHSLDLTRNKIIQLVIFNMGRGEGWSHPVHMHGHRFHVVKMGFPEYDNKTGHFVRDNPDITCVEISGEKVCNNARWTDESWKGGKVPGMQIKNAPRKDTIIVPSGGYVVLRFRADNPGVWFMHCHIEMHSSAGMAIMLNESFGLHPKPPEGFSICGSFAGIAAGKTRKQEDVPKLQQASSNDSGNKAEYTAPVFWGVVGFVLGLVVLAIPALVFLILRRRTAARDGLSLGFLSGRKSYCTL